MTHFTLFLSGAFLTAIFIVHALINLFGVDAAADRTQCRPEEKIVFMKTDPTNPIASARSI